ncbi:hypothetical protein WJX72_005263 [[Myrmecia] bisecta]|uniref:Uncharacterized protein n=1 Tax=[Myrmecia] bisecta TaxID=41462 RepID=A0AAW1Q793_9CHLO
MLALRMPLDHFNSSANSKPLPWTYSYRNFSMPLDDPGYFPLYVTVCPEFYKPGGPLLLWTGNGRGVQTDYAYFNSLLEEAAKYNAIAVLTDRRYFGYSLPDELKYQREANYLNFEQIVEDNAYAVHAIRSEYGLPELPAIHFASGNALALQLRAAHPDIFIGTVTQNMLTLGFPNLEPAIEVNKVFRIATDIAKKADPNCAANIHASWSFMAGLANTTAGRRKINDIWNVCPDYALNSTQDWLKMRSYLTGTITERLTAGEGPVPSANTNYPSYLMTAACKNLAQANMTGEALLVGMKQLIRTAYSGSKGYNASACNKLGADTVASNSFGTLFSRAYVDIWGLARNALDCTGQGLGDYAPSASDGVTDMFYPDTAKNYSDFIDNVCNKRYPDFDLDYNWGARTYGPNVYDRLANTSNFVILNPNDYQQARSITHNVSDTVVVYNMPFGRYTISSVAEYPVMRANPGLCRQPHHALAGWHATHPDVNVTMGPLQLHGAIYPQPKSSVASRKLQEGSDLTPAVAPASADMPAQPHPTAAPEATRPCTGTEDIFGSKCCSHCGCSEKTLDCGECWLGRAKGLPCWNFDEESGLAICAQCLLILAG